LGVRIIGATLKIFNIRIARYIVSNQKYPDCWGYPDYPKYPDYRGYRGYRKIWNIRISRYIRSTRIIPDFRGHSDYQKYLDYRGYPDYRSCPENIKFSDRAVFSEHPKISGLSRISRLSEISRLPEVIRTENMRKNLEFYFTIITIFKLKKKLNIHIIIDTDRLCFLVVRVPGFRCRGSGSIPGAAGFSEK
jgi:hypothetical protein